MKVLLCLVALIVVGIAATSAVLGIHKIDEGSVGVYFFGGAMRDGYNPPGYHWSMPWVTTHVSVPVRLQTTTVNRVECGTAGGVVVYFEAVEVVHRLRMSAVLDIVKRHSAQYADVWIHDRLHWEVNQLCSHHTLQEIYIDKFDTLDERIRDQMNEGIQDFTPGLEVVAVRITKPRIPEIIRVNYERVEELKAQLLVVEQHAANVLRKEETARRKAVMQAEKEAEVSLITMERRLNATISRLQIAEMDAQMHFERQKQHAEARFYQLKKQAQSNHMHLSRKYLDFLRSKHLFANTRLFIGDSVPTAVVEEPMEPPSMQTTSLHSAYSQESDSGPEAGA